MVAAYFFMTYNFSSNRLLGALTVMFAVICMTVWIPFDTDTGLVETVRRRNIIGDSLAPYIAMTLVLCAAFALFRQTHADTRFTNQGNWHLIFLFFGTVFVLSLVLMRYTGPALIMITNFVTDSDHSYRNLRNIWPLKYVGFVCGGTLLLCSFSHFMDKSLTRKRALLFFGISVMIALFFDLPFEDILLPPNGDV